MQLPFHNTEIRHWNPGAEKPLIIPVHMICNTSDEQINANIRANSPRCDDWVRVEPEHDGVAILCGSGPSLADTLPEIRERIAAGGTVFAMNGAAKFLHDNGITADYQVIIDAREETANLIGPARAHLFASQVHPACFDRMPSARLYHLQVEGIDELLPEYPRSFALIGGAASVGNTSTCLAYAMGFRELHCYGYDSCHRQNKSHAFDQPMNNGEPCAYVEFNGKTYLASFTMKLQAEKFQSTARALVNAGCKVFVHGDGLLPAIWNAPRETLTESEKYARMWSHPEYRIVAPGEHCVDLFLGLCKPQEVIDFGCGTGRAALSMAEAGVEVTLVDFAPNCRDVQARDLPFVQHDLTRPLPISAPHGYCTDVMEHIPPEDVGVVLDNVTSATRTTFFQISTVPDVMGTLIGQDLHLTVRPHAWWREELSKRGEVVWEQEQPEASLFVVNRREHT